MLMEDHFELIWCVCLQLNSHKGCSPVDDIHRVVVAAGGSDAEGTIARVGTGVE